MFKPPLDLARARLLLTNDDGIDAPGLKRLEKIARGLAKEVWVVAPESEQSAASHSLTLRQPLRVRPLSARRFAVSGTPTDAVLLAINRIMKASRPDLVLSGINRGANMGEDMTYSGTIAAAMEATLLGIPAIALSLVVAERGDQRPHWATAEAFGGDVITRLTRLGWPPGVLLNVNFPPVAANAVAGIAITREGRRKVGDEIVEGRDPRGQPYYWIGAQQAYWGDDARPTADTDLSAVAAHKISITPVSMDMTHRPTLGALRKAFARGR